MSHPSRQLSTIRPPRSLLLPSFSLPVRCSDCLLVINWLTQPALSATSPRDNEQFSFKVGGKWSLTLSLISALNWLRFKKGKRTQTKWVRLRFLSVVQIWQFSRLVILWRVLAATSPVSHPMISLAEEHYVQIIFGNRKVEKINFYFPRQMSFWSQLAATCCWQ